MTWCRTGDKIYVIILDNNEVRVQTESMYVYVSMA